MRYLFIITSILILMSCRKENQNPEENQNVDTLSICSECLFGKWELVKGIKIIENDTNEVFENNQTIAFRYGVREPDKYNSHLFINVDSNNFLYDELIEKYVNGDDYIVKYTDSWQWLNTTFSKTHLKMHLRFVSAEPHIFRIIKLTNNELEIEYHQAWYVNCYMLYKFKKSDDSPINNQNKERLIRQQPSNLVGLWKLEEFLNETNDSVFTKYSNDTLIYQFIFYNHNVPNLLIYKYPYSLTLKLDNFGVLSATENTNSKIRNIIGYWYWIDNLNPHIKIYIEPTIEGFLVNYDLVKLDDDILILKWGTSSYKYKRIG